MGGRQRLSGGVIEPARSDMIGPAAAMPFSGAFALPSRQSRREGQVLRGDLKVIADMVALGARVLDVGCGDGWLLEYLQATKKVDGRGIELSMAGVRETVAHGLSVIQGDADTDLKSFPAAAFDYVVLSQTLQATRDPRGVLDNMARIGRRVIVSLPNFGYWRVRLQLLFNGRMPRTASLGYEWWETPNIHLCTLKDLEDLCQRLNIRILERVCLGQDGRRLYDFGLTNLLGVQAVYLLERR